MLVETTFLYTVVIINVSHSNAKKSAFCLWEFGYQIISTGVSLRPWNQDSPTWMSFEYMKHVQKSDMTLLVKLGSS